MGEYERNVFCPNCGHENLDSWAIGDGEEGTFEIECSHCDEPLTITRHITIEYTATSREVKP
jgi:hypothetical protein